MKFVEPVRGNTPEAAYSRTLTVMGTTSYRIVFFKAKKMGNAASQPEITRCDLVRS